LIEAAGADLHRIPGDAYRRGVPDDDRDLMAAAELVVPILRDMDREAAVVEMNRYLDAQLRGEEQQVPVLSVLSGISPDGSQRRTEVALDPETADLVDLSWSKSTHVDDEQRFALLNAKVDRFKSGSILPATFFEFNPPGDAKRVDELRIPGLTGSSILNRTAPGFTLEAPCAQTVHLRVPGTAGDACLRCELVRAVPAGVGDNCNHAEGPRFECPAGRANRCQR